jgi:hypothetical protein
MIEFKFHFNSNSLLQILKLHMVLFKLEMIQYLVGHSQKSPENPSLQEQLVRRSDPWHWQFPLSEQI